jgi:hypothetical protein
LTEEQREAWRRKVGSKVVEFAWEKLCGSLVQQWVRNKLDRSMPNLRSNIYKGERVYI